MDAGNSLCSMCRRNIAKFFCCCTGSETLLCEDCLGKHFSYVVAKGHQSWPISLLSCYKNPQYMERMAALERVQTGALQNLGDVDRAIAEFSEKVQEVIDGLTRLRAVKMKQLQEIKTTLAREVPLGLEEVERTLAEERPLLTTRFGPLFRECTEKASTVQLFSYSIETCPPLSLLHLHFQLATSHEPFRFAGVCEDMAFLYDVKSQQITHHTLAVNFGISGSYVELDRDRLLCVGARPASSAVYLLDLRSFQLTSMPSLCTPRRAAGVAKVNARIYAFGGADVLNQNLRSCERMDLSDKRWTDMGSMTHSRGSFTPCYFRSLIYLISCWDEDGASTPLETFNPETDTFAVLSISLPFRLEHDCGSVAFVANEELCVLTGRQQMLRWKIDTEREFRLSDTASIMWSLQQPLIVGSLVLIACQGGVVHFSLETYSYSKYVK